MHLDQPGPARAGIAAYLSFPEHFLYSCGTYSALTPRTWIIQSRECCMPLSDRQASSASRSRWNRKVLLNCAKLELSPPPMLQRKAKKELCHEVDSLTLFRAASLDLCGHALKRTTTTFAAWCTRIN
eukprot:1159827-Pelagomonas_calceolata.AAC.12